MNTLNEQYRFIKATREVLFHFLEEIPLEKLHCTIPNFGHQSIIKTHIYVADCYRYWLSFFAYNKKRSKFFATTDEQINQANVEIVRNKFQSVDEVVEQFLYDFDSRWFEEITNEVKWQTTPWRTTPLWLLSHTQTHEFHHKGQIVSMARQLGYTPPNTDLVYPADVN